MKLTSDIKNSFLDLACDLSPENLHCDGEISRSAAQRKFRALKKRWKDLEKTLGRKVSESEVWTWA